MNQPLDRILRKVKALLSKTTRAGCTAEEAANAAAVAQCLIDEYKLELGGVELGEDAEPIYLDQDPVFQSRKRTLWRERLAAVLATANGCHVILTVIIKGTNRMEVAGKSSNVAVMRYLFMLLSREIDRLATASWKNKAPVWRALGVNATTYGKGFRHGAVSAIYDRLKKEKEEVRKKYEGSQALVRFDGEAQAARSFMLQLFKDEEVQTEQAEAEVIEGALEAGYKAGMAIPMNKSMEGGRTQGLLKGE